MVTLLYVLLAILALSFLIFIHELGHFIMARRVGMRVETFSIGFGRPLVSWTWQGVKWQIGWLPFGGFVRIAGTDVEKDADPYLVKDGFFGKSPWARIKVALMGPLVNILFGLIAFALLWISGGRDRTFAEFTHKMGWVDPKSELYAYGIRPGDEIKSLNKVPYQGLQDLLYIAVGKPSVIEVQGIKKDSNVFTHQVTSYSHPLMSDKRTIGILSPAQFLIYDRGAHSQENPLPESSPLLGSGLQYGDRIVWVDGHTIYSLPELSNILNDGRALVTIERNGKTFLTRVPRVQVEDLKFDPAFRDELIDWQFAVGLNNIKFPKLYAFPYNLTNDGVVENEVRFLDKENENEAFPVDPASNLEKPLQPGDKIIAVDGLPVKHSSEILKQLQMRQVHVIVQRSNQALPHPNWKEADKVFENLSIEDVQKIAQTIGTEKQLSISGEAVLLKPITPKTQQEVWVASSSNLKEDEKKDNQSDSEKHSQAQLQQRTQKPENKLQLGVPIQDLRVKYNPIPTEQFTSVFKEIGWTLKALFSGTISPKSMSGPVGIVDMFQKQSRLSLSEALYWMGMISINLGVLNLLPIPMLDGGTILLSFFEAVTGKKIKPKTLERLILPFAILLITFFVYVTFYDLSKVFKGIWW